MATKENRSGGRYLPEGRLPNRDIKYLTRDRLPAASSQKILTLKRLKQDEVVQPVQLKSRRPVVLIDPDQETKEVIKSMPGPLNQTDTKSVTGASRTMNEWRIRKLSKTPNQITLEN